MDYYCFRYAKPTSAKISLQIYIILNIIKYADTVFFVNKA